MGITRATVQMPGRRRLTKASASNSAIREIPKYFARAEKAISDAAINVFARESVRRPFSQNTSAQIQNASIRVSHMMVVLEMRNPGMSKKHNAASSGREQKRLASTYVPMVQASAGNRNARWRPISLQPQTGAASAIKYDPSRGFLMML